MRFVQDICQDNDVDVVFSGHTHEYQRTVPLKFYSRRQADGALRAFNGCINGKFLLDKYFDGKTRTRPRGVIHVTTGGGGATMYGYGGMKFHNPNAWKPYTTAFIMEHCFTQCDIKGKTMTVRQMSPGGAVLDELKIDKQIPVDKQAPAPVEWRDGDYEEDDQRLY